MPDYLAKDLTDFNVVVQELYKRLKFCGECNGTIYWYEGTKELLFKMISFLGIEINITDVSPRCPHCGGRIERRGDEWYCHSCHFWWEVPDETHHA